MYRDHYGAQKMEECKRKKNDMFVYTCPVTYNFTASVYMYIIYVHTCKYMYMYLHVYTCSSIYYYIHVYSEKYVCVCILWCVCVLVCQHTFSENMHTLWRSVDCVSNG